MRELELQVAELKERLRDAELENKELREKYCAAELERRTLRAKYEGAGPAYSEPGRFFVPRVPSMAKAGEGRATLEELGSAQSTARDQPAPRRESPAMWSPGRQQEPRPSKTSSSLPARPPKPEAFPSTTQDPKFDLSLPPKPPRSEVPPTARAPRAAATTSSSRGAPPTAIAPMARVPQSSLPPFEPGPEFDAVFGLLKHFCQQFANTPPRFGPHTTDVQLPLGLKNRFSTFAHPDSWRAMLRSSAERPLLMARYLAAAIIDRDLLRPNFLRDFPAANLVDAMSAARDDSPPSLWTARQAAFRALRDHPAYERWLRQSAAREANAIFDGVAPLFDVHAADGYRGPDEGMVRGAFETVVRGVVAFNVGVHGLPGAMHGIFSFERFGNRAPFDPTQMRGRMTEGQVWPGDGRGLCVRMCVLPGFAVKVTSSGAIDVRGVRRAEVLLYLP